MATKHETVVVPEPWPPILVVSTSVTNAGGLAAIDRLSVKIKFMGSEFAPGSQAIVLEMGKLFKESYKKNMHLMLNLAVRADDGLSVQAGRDQVAGRVRSLALALRSAGLADKQFQFLFSAAMFF